MTAATPASPPSDTERAPLNRAALAVTVILSFTQDAAYALVFLSFMNHYLLDELHTSPGLPGYTLALYGGTKLLIHPVAGRLLDRTSPRRVYAGAAAIGIVATLLLLLVHTLGGFLMAVVLLAVASASTWPLIYDVVARTQVPTARGAATASLSIAGYIATGVGFATGVLLSNFAPWQMAFVVLFVLVAGPLVLLPMAAFDARPAVRVHEDQQAPPSLRLAEGLLFAAVVLIDYAAISSLAGAYGPYVRITLGISLLRTTVMMIPAAIAALAMLGVAARFSRPSRRLAEMAGLYVLAAFGAFGIAASSNAWAAAAFAIPLAAGAGGIGPIIAATMIEQGGEGSRGFIIGTLMSVEGVGSVIGPAFVAFIINIANPGAGIATIGVMFLILVPLTLGAYAVRRRIPRRQATVVET